MLRLVLAVLLVLGLPADTRAQTMAGDNVEMSQMFEADQEIRRQLMATRPLDQSLAMRMAAEDAERLARTKQLIENDLLNTANDFYHAAFIFQHGSGAKSYLMAHTLAVAAAARGHPKALWIAAATLDRYLQEIGQSQIYGTQYSRPADGEPTMEPYDRDLVPDSLRAILGVPDQAAQAKRLEEMSK